MKTLLLEIGAGLLVILTIFAAGHHVGAGGVMADWKAEKLAHAEQDKAAILKAVADRDAAHALSVRHTNEVLENYANSTAEKDRTIAAERLRADANRMRITVRARACPALPSATAGAIVADGEGADTVEVELPAAVAGNLRDFAEDADREVSTLQGKLDALRQWVTAQGLYGK